MKEKRFDNKTALVTGGSRGIGAKTAQLMAAQGATVFVTDILDQQAQQVSSEIDKEGGKSISIKLDVTKEADWQSTVNQIQETAGGLDILVNNAGVFLGKDFEEMGLSEWQTLVDANMTSVFLGTKICAPLLRQSAKKSPHGSAIVNVSSVAGMVAAPNDALYSMAKGGVTVFTKSTAISFANKGDRIRVNSVHPGVVDTSMGDIAISAQAKRLGVTDAEQVRKLSAERHPAGRIATTEDIANAILFLASDESAFMTGVSMPVDGGYTAQ